MDGGKKMLPTRISLVPLLTNARRKCPSSKSRARDRVTEKRRTGTESANRSIAYTSLEDGIKHYNQPDKPERLINYFDYGEEYSEKYVKPSLEAIEVEADLIYDRTFVTDLNYGLGVLHAPTR